MAVFYWRQEMSDLAMKVLKWQSTGDVGISSATLASIACGMKKNIYGHHFGAPHDAADFRRCVALVEQIPEIRDSFDKVQSAFRHSKASSTNGIHSLLC